MLTSSEIGQLIAGVAAEIDHHQIFVEKAKAARHKMRRSDIERMRQFFHDSPPEPEITHYDNFGGGRFFGVWMSACQKAIFEIAYHFREEALPFLLEVGRGPYDWTQLEALHSLLRLAREGVQPDFILTKITAAMSGFRDLAMDEILYSMRGWEGPLSPEIIDNFQVIAAKGYLLETAHVVQHSHPRLARQYAEQEWTEVKADWANQKFQADGYTLELLAGLHEFLPEETALNRLIEDVLADFFHQTTTYWPMLQTLLPLTVQLPEPILAYEAALKRLADGEAPFANDQRGQPDALEAAQAAVVLYHLRPHDPANLERLTDIAHHHPDETVRRKTAGLLKSRTASADDTENENNKVK